MFKNAYQRGLLTIFFSSGSNPLHLWDTHIQNGYTKRFLDQELKTLVFEIRGTNISTAYMTCPKGKRALGIMMPFLVMIVKNLKKYFSFEVTILDDEGFRRRFRIANFQSSTLIRPLCTVMPIGLADGWNQIQFNLAEFTRRAYNRQFMEVQSLKINANICLRRIYFAEKLLTDEELPDEYKLFSPLSPKNKARRISKTDKENVVPSISKQKLEEEELPQIENIPVELSPPPPQLQEKKNNQTYSQMSLPEPPERVPAQYYVDNVESDDLISAEKGSTLTVLKSTPTGSMIRSKVFKSDHMQNSVPDTRSVQRISSTRYSNLNVIEKPSIVTFDKNSPVETTVEARLSVNGEQTDAHNAAPSTVFIETTEDTRMAKPEEELKNVDLIPEDQVENLGS